MLDKPATENSRALIPSRSADEIIRQLDAMVKGDVQEAADKQEAKEQEANKPVSSPNKQASSAKEDDSNPAGKKTRATPSPALKAWLAQFEPERRAEVREALNQKATFKNADGEIKQAPVWQAAERAVNEGIMQNRLNTAPDAWNGKPYRSFEIQKRFVLNYEAALYANHLYVEKGRKDRGTDARGVRFSRSRQAGSEAERQLVDTQRAYSGRRAYEKEKAQGKTRLTFDQWVQVRTDAFKEWFGDWQAAKGVTALEKSQTFNLDHVQRLPDKKAIEAAFKAFGKVQNRRDGREVVFPVGMAGKIARHKGFDIGRIAGAFNNLFANSIPMYSEVEQLKEGHKVHLQDIEAYHHYVSKFRQGEHVYYVRFTVQRMKAGRKRPQGAEGESFMHSSFVSDVSLYSKSADHSVSVGVRDNPVLAGNAALSDTKLARWLEAGKSAKVSKAVDSETGEPLPQAIGEDVRYSRSEETRIAPIPLQLKGWKGSASELAALARDVYANELQGRRIYNASLGAEIAFTSEGKGEAFGARGRIRSPVRAELVNVLDKLVEHAVKVAVQAPQKGRIRDSKAFHTLVGALQVGSEIVPVRLTIREAALVPEGTPAHRFYDVAVQEKSPVVRGLDGGKPPSHPPFEASRESVADLAAAFNIPLQESTPSTKAQQTQALVDSITQQWVHRPEVVVVESLIDARVPEAVRRENASRKEQGAKGTPEGFAYQGKIYLVAGKLKTDADVVRVLYHEALGHFGLRAGFGSELAKVLDGVARVRREDIAAKLKQYGLADTLQNRRIAAEEVLARMAQERPEIGWVQQAIAAIRTWIRQHIPALRNLRMSDAELVRNFILPAREFVERGQSVTKGRRCRAVFTGNAAPVPSARRRG